MGRAARAHARLFRRDAVCARGEFLIVDVSATLVRDTLRADPVRIVEAIVTGVAFVGAGAVLRDRKVAHGLTTAASLLTVAPIGVAMAMDRYVLAAGATRLLFFELRVVGWIERKTIAKEKPGCRPSEVSLCCCGESNVYAAAPWSCKYVLPL